MLAIVMILDLDVGNTRVKWRLLENGCSVASGSQDNATVIAGELLELPEAVAVGEGSHSLRCWLRGAHRSSRPAVRAIFRLP